MDPDRPSAGPADVSAALTGWALGSAVEGLASVIVIWRFSGGGIRHAVIPDHGNQFSRW
jgi:hypothetical protein